MLAMSSHLRAMPEPSDSSTHGSDATSVVTSNRVTLPRTSMSIPVGRRVTLPKTAATNSFMDEMGTWPTIKLHPDDAAAYLTAEIYEWFRERGIDKEAEILQEEEGPLDQPHVPWYYGGYRGVRIDRALMWHIRMIHESFCDNPYGLSGFFYWLILFAFIFYMAGNIMIGMVDALDAADKEGSRFWLPVFKGALTALPVVWMLTMFMFPALLANRQEQYAAYGHEIDD